MENHTEYAATPAADPRRTPRPSNLVADLISRRREAERRAEAAEAEAHELKQALMGLMGLIDVQYTLMREWRAAEGRKGVAGGAQ